MADRPSSSDKLCIYLSLWRRDTLADVWCRIGRFANGPAQEAEKAPEWQRPGPDQVQRCPDGGNSRKLRRCCPLAPPAHPLQDLIDRILYALAGLTATEAAGLEQRLAGML